MCVAFFLRASIVNGAHAAVLRVLRLVDVPAHTAGQTWRCADTSTELVHTQRKKEPLSGAENRSAVARGEQ